VQSSCSRTKRHSVRLNTVVIEQGGRMKTVERILLMTGLAFFIAAGEALAQDVDPVVGTWELNVAKSAFSPGPAPKSETRIYTVSGSDLKLTLKGIDGDGKPTSIQASYSLDGREHPIIGSPDADSQSITRVDALTTKGTLTKSGKVVQTVGRAITKDGRTMTITFKGVNARGQTINNVMVFERK
jgi:hypothetical protein